ncbi:glutamate/aspartate transport system permease protein [Oxalobacteraceae bacterium GrIS 2.11]
MEYHWNWNIFWDQAPDGGGTYFDTLLSGLYYTLITAGVGWVIALLLGAIIGTIRTMPNKTLARLGDLYIEVFRNIPLLVQMFLWYFVMPELLPTQMGDWIKALPNAPLITGIICLGFFTSARIAIQVSAGIHTLPRGQALAGKALGLTVIQTYRFILLPMAFRIIAPALTNEAAGIIKNSSVALTIGLLELTARTRSLSEFSFQTFEAFTAATLIYIFVSVIAIAMANMLEKNLSVPGFIAASKTGSQ